MSRKRLSYILKLFFSLEVLSKQCYEIDILRRFYQAKWQKSRFKAWMNIRDAIFKAAGRNGQRNSILSDFYLTKPEALVVAERSGFLNIEAFSNWLTSKEREVRSFSKKGLDQKLHDLRDKDVFKSNKIKASMVAWRIMRYYFEEDLMEQHSKRLENLEKKFQAMMEENEDVVEVDSNGDVMFGRGSCSGSVQSEIFEMRKLEEHLIDQRLQCDAVAREVKRLHREANEKRQALLMLTGVTRTLDPLFDDAVKALDRVGGVLEKHKKRVTMIENETFYRKMFRRIGGYHGIRFFELGSDVQQRCFDSIIKTLKKRMVKFYEDVEDRSHAYFTHTSRFRDLVKVMIHLNCQKTGDMFMKLTKKEEMAEKLYRVNQDLDYGKILIGAKVSTQSNPRRFRRSMKLESKCEILDVLDQNIDRRFQELVTKTERRRKLGRKSTFLLEDEDFLFDKKLSADDFDLHDHSDEDEEEETDERLELEHRARAKEIMQRMADKKEQRQRLENERRVSMARDRAEKELLESSPMPRPVETSTERLAAEPIPEEMEDERVMEGGSKATDEEDEDQFREGDLVEDPGEAPGEGSIEVELPGGDSVEAEEEEDEIEIVTNSDEVRELMINDDDVIEVDLEDDVIEVDLEDDEDEED